MTLDPCDLTFGLGDNEPSFSVTAPCGVLQGGGEPFGLLGHPIGKVCGQSTQDGSPTGDAAKGTCLVNRAP